MAAFSPVADAQRSQCFPTAMETCSISLSNTDTVKFIQLYQQQELLWNVNLPDHTNKTKRSECLTKISHIMGLNWSEQQVKDKILSLRSRYSKELVKVRVSIAAGAEHYAPGWRFFPLLDSFLRPFCTTRKTNTPVVRAFHQRLMAGMVQLPRSSLSAVQVSQHVTLAPSTHFHSTSGPASSYHCNYHNAPLSNTGYQDDDDDVQILEEEYTEEEAQEDSVYIDDDDDYDKESSEQKRARKSSALQENTCASSSVAEAQRDIYSDKEHPHNNESHQDNVSHQNVHDHPDQTLSTHLQDAATVDSSTPIRTEAQTSTSGIVTFFTEDVELTRATESPGNELSQAEVDDSSETSEKVDVKQEKFTSPPSPPAPPLPSKPYDLPVSSSSQNSNHSLQSTDAVSGPVLTHGNVDTNRPNEVSTQNAKVSNSTDFLEEPVRKKIKQENQQTAKITFNQMKHAGESCHAVRDGHINSCDRMHTNHRSQVNRAIEKELRTETTSQNPNQMVSAVADVSSEITNQVTNAVTNLLQTLVANLVEKSSPGVTSDSELAFVNHIVCELRKLDEDLQADVKFSIQRALYDAQKEMQQRKSQVSHPKSPG